MSDISIVSLSHGDDLPAALVGPKALSLLRMRRVPLPVPPAVCITTEAYREHLRNNHLVPVIEQTLDDLEETAPSSVGDLLGSLREQITAAPVAEELSRECERSLASLPGPQYAVRSSAIGEDLPGHSFAGLHDTILGVRDHPSCLAAVKQCWASLWTPRAYIYRRENRFDHHETAMAVMIQSLIPAEASGVIFTANPLTGRPGCITIESCWGLGEALVSGKVTPDRFTFTKKTLRLAYVLLAEKSIAYWLDDAGRIREETLDTARAQEASLEPRIARKLARHARTAEQVFGCPQDLEWARSNGRLYFLQSRPITTKPQQLSWEDRQVWTNLNLGEVAPDVMTPVTRSFVTPLLDRLFHTLFKILGVDPGSHPIGGVLAGRMYFNVNTGFGAFRHLPFAKHQEFETIFGGAHAEYVRSGQLDMAEEDIPHLKGSLLKMVLRLPLTLYDIYRHRPSRARTAFTRFRAETRTYDTLDVPALSTPKLVAALKSVFTMASLDMDLMYLMTSLFALPMVYNLTAKWLDDPHGAMASRLFTGMGSMIDAEAGFALWRMAHLAHTNSRIGDTLNAGHSWKQTREALAAIPEGAGFIRAWDAFLAEHGHHCRGEIELYNPRWAETPDYCLDLVRSHLACIGAADPDRHEAERAEERRQTLAACRKHLRNPFKRWLFTWLVKQAQNGSVLRENYKNEAVRLVAAGRTFLIELGGRLAERGTLKSHDDIFFVEWGEIETLALGQAPSDLATTIEKRRNDYEKFCAITPPKVIVGTFDPDNFTPDPVDTSRTTLKGICASPGVVTGKARVILKADTDQHLEPGEILVAPFTDPGWTPYFLPAAAIVMDQGGILSHGSIVAREFGIPAVVNVGPATRIIATGQTITVDADRGIVYLTPVPPGP